MTLDEQQLKFLIDHYANELHTKHGVDVRIEYTYRTKSIFDDLQTPSEAAT